MSPTDRIQLTLKDGEECGVTMSDLKRLMPDVQKANILEILGALENEGKVRSVSLIELFKLNWPSKKCCR